VYEEMKGTIPPFKGNARTRLGLIVEPVTITRYQERTGRIVRPNKWLCQSREIPFLAATFDALHTGAMLDGSSADVPEDAPLEVKMTSKRNGEDWNGKIPNHYAGQFMAQLLVSGHTAGAMGAYFDDEDDDARAYTFLRAEYTDEQLRSIVEQLREFWRRLELNDPPPLGAGDETPDNLKRLMVTAKSVEVFDLGASFATVAADLEAAKAAKKEADAKVEQIESSVKSAMVTAGTRTVRAPDGTIWQSKNQTRKATVCKHCGEIVNPATTFPVLRKGK
jgi:predicted phage-related endonuclease